MSTVKVLSMNRADPIHFTKINEFGDMTDLTPEDMLFITAERDGEEVTKNVRIRDFGQFFKDFNVDAQWFIPVVNGSKLSWQWSEAVNSLPDIDIAAMIPSASESLNGLMTSVDKVKLDNLSEAVINTPICSECVLTANGWNPSTLTQKIMMRIDTNNRNAIDYPPEYNQIVSQHHILAIREESDGITFQCDSIPASSIIVYVTSMKVTRRVN